MSDYPEAVEEQLSRVREALKALEASAENTLRTGHSDATQRGARIAILADGGGHIWKAAEPHASEEELVEVVDALITFLQEYRSRLLGLEPEFSAMSH